jgi:hypothetical protein
MKPAYAGEPLIVPAEASTFHQPRKGSLDDPPAGKHYEPVQLVALDDLDDDASRITDTCKTFSSPILARRRARCVRGAVKAANR